MWRIWNKLFGWDYVTVHTNVYSIMAPTTFICRIKLIKTIPVFILHTTAIPCAQYPFGKQEFLTCHPSKYGIEVKK